MTGHDPADQLGDADVIGASLEVPERFGVIFDRHHSAIFGYLARRVGRDRAEDLTSEVFIRAFDRRSTFDVEYVSARPWLFGIARNVFLNDRRAQYSDRTGPLFDTDIATVDHADAVADAFDAQAVLDNPSLADAVTSLHPDIRETLLLFAVDQLTYGEIATVLGVPLGTVRSRLGRARAAIREQANRGKRIRHGDDGHV